MKRAVFFFWAAFFMLFFAVSCHCGDDDDSSGNDDDFWDDDAADDDAAGDDDDDHDDDNDDSDDDDDNDNDDDTSALEPKYSVFLWPDETDADVLAEWYDQFVEWNYEIIVEVTREHLDVRDPNVERIFLESAAAGVPARPGIIASWDDGLYANEANFDEYFDAVMDMIDWAEDASLPINWIGVDMETPVQMVMEIEDHLFNFRLLEALQVLLDHRDPILFAQSQANYQAMVDYCHDHGFNVHVVSFPFVLDDYSDADTGLQDAFDVVVTGVDWDEVDFMIYRTMYQDYTHFPLTSDLVFQYGRMAKTIFGDLASVFIGLVLWDGWFAGDLGYQDSAELEADIEAALAAGIERIHLFYLTGILEKDDPAAWLHPDTSGYQAPPRDPFTRLITDVGMPALDFLL